MEDRVGMNQNGKKRADIFLMPCLGYLAMLPVLVITFPDTRFYLAEMSIAGAAACSSVLTLVAKKRGLR